MQQFQELYLVIPSQIQGVKLDGPLPPMPPPYVNPDNEKAKETEVTKDKVQPESSQSTANVQPRVDHGKGKDKLKDNEKGMNEKEKDDEVRESVFEEILIDKEEFFLPKSPPIKPNKPTKTLPYPSRVEYEKKGENDKVQIQKFWEMFKKIHVNITLADALILMPKYQKMLKSLLSNKEKLNEMANTPVSENCSAIILKKLPEKLEDPGQFLIPCTFSELKCKALADLGASINLMPFSVYTKLGLPALQSTRMTLELANCSLCVPKGIARDVLVPVGRLTFPADFVVVDFECDYRVPLILGRPFLRTARTLIDVFGEEMSLRTDEERLIISVRSEELKYTTRPHKESVCMIDIFSSPKEKDEDSNAIFTSSEVVKCDFLTTNGDPITPSFTIPTKKDLTNEKVEKHEVKTCNISRESSSICPSIKERLNFWKNKEVLEKNEILKRNNTCDFQTPSSSLEKKEVEGEKTLDVKTIVSFFAPIGNCVRKWATNEFVKDNDGINHEDFKSDNENVLGVHDNEEEEIAFLDGLLEDENFFEMNDKKVEFLERKTKEDFETKDEPKSKKELQVFHPDIEILNHFETTSYVGSDYVFYEDFNLVDMLFPMNIQGKIFDPGITFHEKSFEKAYFIKDKIQYRVSTILKLFDFLMFLTHPTHP
ncbi:reverse transcriptase domain-containing protein [Tanacetum coccineum]